MEQLLSASKAEDDGTICLAEVIEIDFYRWISKDDSVMFLKHDTFENGFKDRVQDKCGHDIKLKTLS